MMLDVARNPRTWETSPATAFAQALLPEGFSTGGADARTVEKASALVEQLSPGARVPWRLAHESLSLLARIQTGKPLEQLEQQRVQRLLEQWGKLPVVSSLVHSLASVYKLAHFDRADIRGSLRHASMPLQCQESPRWLHNVMSAYDVDEELECDAVVVGTGAGGAVVGRQLAAQGKAVVFVDEGQLKRRDDYPGSIVGALTQLYDTILTLGNSPIIIPRGRLVGGSTAVNGGSSFRIPENVTKRWQEQLDSAEFSLDGLLPHFEAVESFLQVEAPSLQAVGPFHGLFERGCDSLGWHHDVIKRNAPGCQGDGFCDTGCRSGARRSTEVSYIPDALDRGAVLLTQLAVDEILIKGGRAVGVRGWAQSSTGQMRRVSVRSRAVIVATGALVTPILLQQNRVGLRSGQLGRNLTVHPSGATLALYDQQLEVAKYIPQADFSAQFMDEGLLFLTAHPDEHVLPAILSQIGPELMRAVDQRHRIAGVGFLANDSTRGRVRVGPGGRAIVTYQITPHDVRLYQRAHALLAELALTCGAQEVYPGLKRPLAIRGSRDLERFKSMKMRASDFTLSAFHPLGTCRMSPSSNHGIVNTNHEAFDLERLFVVDGSVVSGPIGVNPQLTIMALARRAAEKIGESLDRCD